MYFTHIISIFLDKKCSNNSKHSFLFGFFFSIFRCTLTKIPENNALLQKSRLPLGILIHPFRDLNVSKKKTNIFYLFDERHTKYTCFHITLGENDVVEFAITLKILFTFYVWYFAITAGKWTLHPIDFFCAKIDGFGCGVFVRYNVLRNRFLALLRLKIWVFQVPLQCVNVIGVEIPVCWFFELFIRFFPLTRSIMIILNVHGITKGKIWIKI